MLGDALISGRITWSMAVVLVTIATPEDAHFWLAEAEQRTVPEMRDIVLERKGASAGDHLESAEEPLRTLTVTVSREDAWCFERARLAAARLCDRRAIRSRATGQQSFLHQGQATACLAARPAPIFWPARWSAARSATKRRGWWRGVATFSTVDKWVERAKERTLRHLREDIDAAELMARWRDGSDAVLPPSDQEVQQLAELERDVIAGQMSPPPVTSSSLGRVTLRLRMRASTACVFDTGKRCTSNTGPATDRFLRFACDLFTEAWRPRVPEVAFGQIDARDRYRCQSPCCGRRDVTPHHLRFRSHGGDDLCWELLGSTARGSVPEAS